MPETSAHPHREPKMPAWTGLISEAELEVYRQAGYQKQFGLGMRPALLIIDVEYNFTGDVDEPILDSIAKYANSCGPMAWQSIPHIATLLAVARSMKLPIAYSHGHEEPDTVRSPRLGTAIVDELAPLPGELVIAKSAASAFFDEPGELSHRAPRRHRHSHWLRHQRMCASQRRRRGVIRIQERHRRGVRLRPRPNPTSGEPF